MQIFGAQPARRLNAPVVVVLVTLLVCSACGKDGSTEQTTAPPVTFVVTSGTFAVTPTLVFNNCPSLGTLGDVYEIVIDSTYFAMGTDWTGTWDANAARGVAEGEHERLVFRFCTNTRWMTAYITFHSEDEFTGSVIYRSRLSGTCDDDRDPCSTSWTLKGTRI